LSKLWSFFKPSFFKTLNIATQKKKKKKKNYTKKKVKNFSQSIIAQSSTRAMKKT